MKDNLIGVIGAGVMGQGVAHSFAEKGFKVLLVDVNEIVLDQALIDIEKNIRFNGFFNKQSSSINAKEVIENITFTNDYTLLKKQISLLKT